MHPRYAVGDDRTGSQMGARDMPEIKTPLHRVPAGDVYANTTDEDAFVITDRNTHIDILRFVVADIGLEEVVLHLESMKP
jgi:hypothetical protein